MPEENTEENRDRIEPINVSEEMSKSFLDYSMSVIVSRALPDVRDGLKPSQRRILFAMNDLGLSPGKQHRKCAKICGDTSGNYHPHGEGVIYPTLVHMAQPWAMREILVEGQGNFGSVEGDPPAAMRYTEARLTHLGLSLMEDMDKDTVDFVANYDETRTEPVVFPAAIPNLLVNGGTGIAVGMATNIPPHNLAETIDAICAQIDEPGIGIEGLMRHMPGPDFPTGCQILGSKGIREYMRTGRGSVRVRGKAEITEDARGRSVILIHEIPYNVNRAVLVSRIAELVNQKILQGISAIRDESDENTRVVVELKRDGRPQVILNNLYKYTQLETSFSVNMLAIDNRRPKLLSVKDAITAFIEHRREVILRRTRYLLGKAEERAEILEAFLIAIDNLDEFIRLIRSSANRDEAREKLQAHNFSRRDVEGIGILIRNEARLTEDGRYHFTRRQVDAILELRLYQLTALELDKTQKEYGEVIDKIKDLLDILAREERVLDIIKAELLAIKEKHGSPRRTQIVPALGDIEITDLIANEPMVVTLSHRGFIKRTNLSEYKAQRRGGKGVRGMTTREAQGDHEENDFVEHLFSAAAHDYLLFFTNTGRLYVERVFEVPEGNRAAKGRSIVNVLNLRPEEKIAAVQRLQAVIEEGEDKTWESDQFVFFATRSGKVKKTKLIAFRNYRKDGIIAIRIDEGNELIDVRLTSGDDDVCLITRVGLCVRCHESTVRSMGRPSAGVAGIRPRDEDYLVALTVVQPEAMLLVASERGIGKRTPFDDYPIRGRGGKGVITMKTTEKTGMVVGALGVSEEDELMLITTGGQMVRIRVAEVRATGRNAQGVKLIDPGKGKLLQGIARVISDDEEEEDDAETEGGEGEGAETVDAEATDAPAAPETEEETGNGE